MKFFSLLIFYLTTLHVVSQNQLTIALTMDFEEDSSYIDSENRWVGVIKEKIIDTTQFQFDENWIVIYHTIEVHITMLSDTKESGLFIIDSIGRRIFPEEFPEQKLNLGQLSINCIENGGYSTSKTIESNMFRRVKRAEVKSLLSEFLNSSKGRPIVSLHVYKNSQDYYSLVFWSSFEQVEVIDEIYPLFKDKCFFTLYFDGFKILIAIEE